MTTLLAKAGANLTVKQLLDTLQEVLDFEASLVKKFAVPVRVAKHDNCAKLIVVKLPDILKATQPASATRQNKPISAAFESHMGVFVSAQDKFATSVSPSSS